MHEYTVWFDQVGMDDVALVGGKNASLGEMISHLSIADVNVPPGFATTAPAFIEFLQSAGIDQKIRDELTGLDVDDLSKLSHTGQVARELIRSAALPAGLEQAIRESYAHMETREGENCSVAVRSSATAEDLPDASFAGQQESYLNVCGIEAVLGAVKDVFASLFNDRAIAYRCHQGYAHDSVSISAGIQKMVRSDLGSSGVMFTLDTESGFPDVVFITSAWGLGETVVQGMVNPDEFYVFKPSILSGCQAVIRRTLGSKQVKMIFASSEERGHSTHVVDVEQSDQQRFSLSDDDLETLARYALAIESHYQRPMDIEWGRDGSSGRLFILQARPETVRSRESGRVIQRYRLDHRGVALSEGRSIGARIGSGVAKVLRNHSQMSELNPGDVLIADMTDPDWEPIMTRAAAIVTNRGGRTCHAAIIARELGIPAVVGTGDATHTIPQGEPVTVSCAEGETGYVYRGALPFEIEEIRLDTMPEVPLKVTMNVANPDRAFDFSAIPNHGVGLARLEFIINRMVGVHPKALLELDQMDTETRQKILERSAGYADPISFYVEKVVEGVASIAAAFSPKPVIVRLSDFKSNEYFNLLGGDRFEPREENPMFGFRGASRYLSPAFKDCFELECRALRKVREEMGLENVEIMVPFVRTVAEARGVVDLLGEFGLERGKAGLRLIMMCELPSNALLADEFLEYFDGFSIGSNDLTQLTLGLDRDSSLVAASFDERDAAIKILLRQAITACRKAGKYVGICGQGPSDHPDFAEWLLDQGIESISLNPDSVVETWLRLGRAGNSGNDPD